MTDAQTVTRADIAPLSAVVAPPVPTADEIAAAHALLASAAAAKPLPQAMAELCADADVKAAFAKLTAARNLYPNEPSNDLAYGVLSIDRLMKRYAA